jgi:hypothetical protein
MNVWARIYSYPTAETEAAGTGGILEVESALCIAIHPSEESAREAAKNYGGIAMQIVAESLRGEPSLSDNASIGTDNTAGSPSSYLFVQVHATSLPHETWTQCLSCGEDVAEGHKESCDGEQGTQELLGKFEEPGESWLSEVSKALGVGLTQ